MILQQAKAFEVQQGYIDLGISTDSTTRLDVKHYIQLLKKSIGPAAIKSKWLTFALRGNNVQCPCCNKKFLTFTPAGLSKRPNARCVNCNSLERHRNIWLYLLQKTDFFKEPLKVLNVAPEPFFYKKFSKLPNIAYFPIDKYPEEFGYGRKTIRMDITDLRFASETFDVIICNHVLEHVENDRKALKEMQRVLKPGGWAILNSPVDKTKAKTYEDFTITDPKKRLEHFGQQDHVRVYGRDYIDRLFNAGFEVKIIDFADTFSPNQRFRYGLKEGDEIYHCYKK